MKRKVLKIVPLLVLMVLILVGCATRVRFDAPRTPNMDVSGITSVTVAQFTTAVSAAAPVAENLRSRMLDEIRAAGFELRESGADATFRGRVTHYATSTTPRQVQRAVVVNNVRTMQTFTVHERVVEVAFEYYFVRDDGRIVGPIRRTARQTQTRDSVGDLPAATSMATNAALGQLRLFYRDIRPHTIQITRVMEREGNRELRPAMDAADRLRRDGFLMDSRDAYVAIWENNRSVAAAINAAVIYEAMGDIEGGILLMEQVLEVNRHASALRRLNELNREAAELMGLEALAEYRPAVERLAEHAISEMRPVVAEGARLWIHNNAVTDQALVEGIIANMTSELLREGFVIVERGMLDMVLSEQNLHLEGGVADSDFISIGNLAGANTVISIGMIGTGGARRLQLRVLDIETATVRMQSGTGIAWRP